MSNGTSKEKRSPDSTIIAAVITGVVTIIVTAITVFANRPAPQPVPTAVVIVATPTVSSPISTDAAPPDVPTAPPVPTDTPLPEPTSTATEIPLLKAGEDWLSGCISMVWQVFPADTAFSTKDGCYTRPLANVFSARSERLEVFFDGRVGSDEVVGIFVEIPSDSLVEFTTHLESVENGELWMGIFEDKNIDSKGLVLAAPAGNMKNSAFVVRTLPGDDKFLTGKFKKDTGDYLISFDVKPSKVTALLEIYTSAGTAPVPSETKWLFLGYKAIAGGSNIISGYFSNLVITPR